MHHTCKGPGSHTPGVAQAVLGKLVALFAAITLNLVACAPDASFLGQPDAGTGNDDVVMTADNGGSNDTGVMQGCSEGETLCGGACVNAQTDNTNCGGCGRSCASGTSCSAGTCVGGNVDAGGPPTTTCTVGTTTCSDGCRNTQTDSANCGGCGRVCLSGSACVAGTCVRTCPPGQTACGNACVDLQTDANSCGACGNVCAPGTGCVGGTCALVCTSPRLNCGGACVDTQSDVRNCGTCGYACAINQACVAGRCEFGICPPGQNACGDRCVDLRSNPDHCGACGNTCSSRLCRDGACVGTNPPPVDAGTPDTGNPQDAGTVCPVGLIACGSQCFDPRVDPFNCGACNNACRGGWSCVNSVCQVNCPSGQNACGDVCRNLWTDANNCGACGRSCASGQICNGGTCTDPACASGQVRCSGTCRNIQSDNANCGACGVVCASGTTCVSGSCTWPNCPSGQLRCGTTCVNISADTSNCGACGRVCASGQSCNAGVCTTPPFTCASGLVNCSGVCRNLQSDTNNCGACGRTCASGQTCNAGVCTTPAPRCTDPRYTDCGGYCANLRDNRLNCGACGRACASNQVCWEGGCTLTPPNWYGATVEWRMVFTGTPSVTFVTTCGGSNPYRMPIVWEADGVQTPLTQYTSPTSVIARSPINVGPLDSGSGCGSLSNVPNGNKEYMPCPFGGNTAASCGGGFYRFERRFGYTGGTYSNWEDVTARVPYCQPPEWSGTGTVGRRFFLPTHVSPQLAAGGVFACPPVTSPATCSGAWPTYCSATHSCVNTQTDPTNCGGCGRVCVGNAFCSAGVCVTAVP